MHAYPASSTTGLWRDLHTHHQGNVETSFPASSGSDRRAHPTAPGIDGLTDTTSKTPDVERPKSYRCCSHWNHLLQGARGGASLQVKLSHQISRANGQGLHPTPKTPDQEPHRVPTPELPSEDTASDGRRTRALKRNQTPEEASRSIFFTPDAELSPRTDPNPAFPPMRVVSPAGARHPMLEKPLRRVGLRGPVTSNGKEARESHPTYLQVLVDALEAASFCHGRNIREEQHARLPVRYGREVGQRLPHLRQHRRQARRLRCVSKNKVFVLPRGQRAGAGANHAQGSG